MPSNESEIPWSEILNPSPESDVLRLQREGREEARRVAEQLRAEEMAAGTEVAPVPRAERFHSAAVPVPVRRAVRLTGTVEVERALEQPDVAPVREALLEHAPAGRYVYDVGLTCASPWGDSEAFHVIKIWHIEPGHDPVHAASRIIGVPNRDRVRVTVQGILTALERIKAIRDDRDAYPVRTIEKAGEDWVERRYRAPVSSRRITDNPQA